MKRLLFFGFFIAVFWSCSIDDSVDEVFRFEILPIETVEMPSSVKYNEVYNINYTYLRPSTCHVYNDLYYVSEGNFITVAVINTVINTTETSLCEPLENEIEDRSFAFHVQKDTGFYVFKFWQGEDEFGQDSYLVIEVPIE